MNASLRAQCRPIVLFIASALPLGFSTWADTFGSGINAFTMEFVAIGNPGNANDTLVLDPAVGRFGGVPYNFMIGKYEVSRDVVAKANDAGGLGITMADMSVHGGNGTARPATGVTWFEAATFVNWLNTSSGFAPAYNFDAGKTFSLWSAADAWQQGGENRFRNRRAHYFLPTENEWYKAAYFNGERYFEYPTGSDQHPHFTSGGTLAGSAVFDPFELFLEGVGPADANNAGGLSSYGTMGQGGNVWELMEGPAFDFGDPATSYRAVRGGDWQNYAGFLASWASHSIPPSDESYNLGFRVVAVPEPEHDAAVAGLLLLATGLGLRRRG